MLLRATPPAATGKRPQPCSLRPAGLPRSGARTPVRRRPVGDCAALRESPHPAPQPPWRAALLGQSPAPRFFTRTFLVPRPYLLDVPPILSYSASHPLFLKFFLSLFPVSSSVFSLAHSLTLGLFSIILSVSEWFPILSLIFFCLCLLMFSLILFSVCLSPWALSLLSGLLLHHLRLPGSPQPQSISHPPPPRPGGLENGDRMPN